MQFPTLYRFAAVALSLLVFDTVGPVIGQTTQPTLVRANMSEWSQWRGPRRDGISEETGLLTNWPSDGPTQLWTAEGIGRGYSSPIVADGSVYITGDVGDDLVITALSLKGGLRWQVKSGLAWKRSFPGARSSCTYDDGKLYHMNAHGRLVCLEPKTGQEVWAVNVLERFGGQNITWGISESLLIHGDLVYATPCGDKGLVVALDKATGDTVWATPAIAGEKPSYASPILIQADERMLLVNSATKYAFAVDAKTGELCWKVPQEDPKNTVTTIPVLGGSDLLFTNSSRGYGAVFGVHLDGCLGEKSWKKELTIGHGSTICVDGQIYGASGRGLVRGWVSLDAATGALQTVSDLPGGSLIYADGHFYCLTQQGNMTLQKPAAGGFETVGSFSVADDAKDVWAHPVINQGRLYLRVHDRLLCFDIRS